jgi:hypothetical protein
MIDLSDPSGVTAGVAAVISVLLGGGVTSRLGMFLQPQGEFRDRIDRKTDAISEGLTVRHASLLNYCRNYDNDLRGDGRNEPDLVGEYTAHLKRLFVMLNRLELLKLVVKWAYWVLYMLISLGIIAFLVNTVFDEVRAVVFWYGVGAVLVELAVIGAVFAASQKLGDYEDVV